MKTGFWRQNQKELKQKSIFINQNVNRLIDIYTVPMGQREKDLIIYLHLN